MIVLTNKCCEILPIEDLSKIKIKGKINTLTYIVDDGKQKYRKNNFTHPRNADKEYPLMIIVDSKFKRLFCCGDDKKSINLRNELVSDTILLQKDDDYRFVKRMIREAKLKLWFENIKTSIKGWFLGLWYAGIRNKKVIIRKQVLTLQDNLPQIHNAIVILSSINEMIEKVQEVNNTLKCKSKKELHQKFMSITNGF